MLQIDNFAKATASGPQGGNCLMVDFKSLHGYVVVIDSKQGDDPIPLVFTAKEWVCFLTGAKAGEFDLTEEEIR